SAHAITAVVMSCSTVVIQGVSQSATIITGNTLGEGDVPRTQAQGEAFLGLAMALGLLAGGIILLIGHPVVLIALFYYTEGKSSWKYLFGGFGFSRKALILIVFSAFIFGAGHLTNWGWWKFFPTFVFGLIAGYLFCKYGVYATIMLHFLTDYMSAESWFFGTSNATLTALSFFMLSVACIPYTYIYVRKLIVGTKDVFKGRDKET
ncbi:MAG: CPBP family intramembrane metalloprotease, partial [Candidatus Methanomethylophilaceae archaeon]|nr:CPBP family intramembrane metalloprotease [Candidatus Methanomethylophilaceae archaeon]